MNCYWYTARKQGPKMASLPKKLLIVCFNCFSVFHICYVHFKDKSTIWNFVYQFLLRSYLVIFYFKKSQSWLITRKAVFTLSIFGSVYVFVYMWLRCVLVMRNIFAYNYMQVSFFKVYFTLAIGFAVFDSGSRLDCLWYYRSIINKIIKFSIPIIKYFTIDWFTL